jgi:DNA-binding Lrp family transcriptional regulator
MDRLEELGIITGYTITVDHAKLGWPLEAYCELRFAGTAKVDDISTLANDIPEVSAVFTTAGDPHALVWMRVKDVDDLKPVIGRLGRTGKVVGTKTLMVLSAWRPGTGDQ